MSSKKIISLVLAAVIAVSLFAGCSANKKDDSDKTNESSEFTQAVTDENGEVVTDENGKVVTEKVQGETVTDENGKAVTEVVTDESGEAMTDSSGKAVTQAVTNKSSSDNSETPSSDKKSNNTTATAKSKSKTKTKTTTTTTTKKSSSNITAKPKSPSVPSSLKTSNVKQTSLKLSWKSVKCSGYQIAVSSDNGSNWKTLEKKYTSTSYTASKLTSYTDYQFRVRAYNKNDYGTSYSDWTIVTVKTKADSDNSRKITVSVKLPSSGGKDKINIYVDNELVSSESVTLDGSNYKYKTDKKYKGVVTISAELEDLGNARVVKTDKDSCYLSLDGNSIIVVDGEDD